MMEQGLTTPGGRLKAAEQEVEEPEAETENQWTRVKRRIRWAEVEQVVQVTDAETGLWKAAVELERQRTEEEL